jgi:hypothetical protein
MLSLWRISTGVVFVALTCGVAGATTINGTCSTAGPGGTELGPGTTTTNGTVTCTGFSGPMGAVLQSVTLTLEGAVVAPSTITITNNNSTAETGDAFGTVNYTLDNPAALPGFTFPLNGPPSSHNIFQAFGDTGTQTVPGNTALTFNVSGTGSVGPQTDSNAATFGTYEAANFSFVFDTATTITSTFGGGNNSVSQSTTVDGTALVSYNYIIPSGTPEPATMVLFGSALVGLGLIRKRIAR